MRSNLAAKSSDETVKCSQSQLKRLQQQIRHARGDFEDTVWGRLTFKSIEDEFEPIAFVNLTSKHSQEFNIRLEGSCKLVSSFMANISVIPWSINVKQKLAQSSISSLSAHEKETRNIFILRRLKVVTAFINLCMMFSLCESNHYQIRQTDDIYIFGFFH